jgi:hypothetical protein
MNMTDIPKRLFRYTSLTLLIDLLWRKKIALVSPRLWRYLPQCDHNDVKGMETCEHLTGKAAYVLCLTAGEESNFYWDSLGGGAGCRIDFKGPLLAQTLASCPGIRHGPVSYQKIPELEAAAKSGALNAADIPFTKRFPYRHEKEYRFVWEGKRPRDNPPVMEFDISLDAIAAITLSDAVGEEAAASFKEVINAAIPELSRRISLVTVHENRRWLAALGDLR